MILHSMQFQSLIFYSKFYNMSQNVIHLIKICKCHVEVSTFVLHYLFLLGVILCHVLQCHAM